MLQLQYGTAESSLLSSFENLEFIAAGQSEIVYKIDDGKVLKQYTDSNDGDVERRAYKCLGSHPNIARFLGTTTGGSIILGRGQVLRKQYQQAGADQIPLYRKLHWLRQAAEGYRYIHEKGIVHADVGCHNMILSKGDHLEIIDFEGCSIDGEEAGSLYEWFSYRRSTQSVSKETDIFAFGFVIYEIMTGRLLYHELEESKDRIRLVEQKYQENHFPNFRHLPLAEVMQSCWHGTFNSMNEVIQALEVASHLSFKARFRSAIIRVFKSSCCFRSNT